jgi:hypothetical protein
MNLMGIGVFTEGVIFRCRGAMHRVSRRAERQIMTNNNQTMRDMYNTETR